MDGDVAVESVPLSLVTDPIAAGPEPDADGAATASPPTVDASTSVSPSSTTSTPGADLVTESDLSPTLAPTTEAPAVGPTVAAAEETPKEAPATGLDDDTAVDLGEAHAIAGGSGGGGGGEGTVTMAEEGGEYPNESDQSEVKRVKVYQLMGTQWRDRGTAFCFGHFSQDGTEALLTARQEGNFQEIVLTTTIRSNDVYQRQQETLIVWTEPDGVDYALSFQEPEGCSEVWNFIQEVQRHMNNTGDEQTSGMGSSSPLLGGEGSTVITANIIRTGHLPTPQMGIIHDIETAIKSLSRTQTVKERICEYIQQEDYIKQLIDVLSVAERSESLENLHALFSLMLTILMLNDHSMYEHILEDELFHGVVGMLEYDPEFPTHKANYREFLTQATHFHEPITFRDSSIQRKIHHTYRLQFLKDVVLARALDDSTFNVLNSCIIFNQIDIITHIQQDNVFLRQAVRLYVNEDILSGGGVRQPQPEGAVDDAKLPSSSPKPGNGIVESPPTPQPSDPNTEAGILERREVILLIQQLCVMGKNVQLPARMALFRSLVDRGILFAVQWAINLDETVESNKPIMSSGGEVLAALLDHDINGVRGHVLKQVVALEKERVAGKKGAEDAETILQTVCRVMATSKDLAVQSQVGDALKTWLDLPPDLTVASANSEAHPSKPPVRKDDPGTERFMDYFYKDCAKAVFTPFDTLPDWRNGPEFLPLTREATNQYVYLCDLLYNFVFQHHFRSHFFVMSTSVLNRIPTLFKARDKHLQHAAFRIFRVILKQGNPNMLGQVMKFDIVKPILDLTMRESRRDSLLSCSCQEYFQHMIKENLKDMIKFCMTKHEAEIRALAKTPLGATRFRDFVQKYERNNEPPPVETKVEKLEHRGWPLSRSSMEAEEEDYFNGDDDDTTLIPSISSQAWTRGLKRKRRVAIRGSLPLRVVPPLVDYDDDEGEGDDVIGPKPLLVPVPAIDEDEDAEDRLLEELMTKGGPGSGSGGRPQSPAPGMMSVASELGPMKLSELGPMKMGEKRRRAEEDDEDEELMERLARAKKVDLGAARGPGARRRGGAGGEEQVQKKFRVKIGLPKPVEAGAKDGDTG